MKYVIPICLLLGGCATPFGVRTTPPIYHKAPVAAPVVAVPAPVAVAPVAAPKPTLYQRIRSKIIRKKP